MRNGIFLAIGAVLLAPFLVSADTGGSASATLTLNAVIDIAVNDQWDPLTIAQGDIAGWAAGTVIDWDPGTNDIQVLIRALTDFNLWACYYAKENGADVNPAFGDPGDLLILYDGATSYTLTYEEITDPNAYTGPYEGTLTSLYTFTGDNNLGSGGTSLSYEVRLKPENLGDRTAGETIDFTIVFVVEDPTI